MAFRIFIPIPSIVNIHGGKLKCSAECCPQLLRYLKNKDEISYSTSTEQIENVHKNESLDGFYIRNFNSCTNMSAGDQKLKQILHGSQIDLIEENKCSRSSSSSSVAAMKSTDIFKTKTKPLKRLQHKKQDNQMAQYLEPSNQQYYGDYRSASGGKAFNIKYPSMDQLCSDTHNASQLNNQRYFSSTSLRNCERHDVVAADLENCNQLIAEHKKINPEYVNLSRQDLKSGSFEERKAVEEAVNFATRYKKQEVVKFKAIKKRSPYNAENSKSGFDRMKYQFRSEENRPRAADYSNDERIKSKGHRDNAKENAYVYKRLGVPWPSYADKLRQDRLKIARDLSNDESIVSDRSSNVFPNKSRTYSTDSRNTISPSDIESEFSIDECLFSDIDSDESLSFKQLSRFNYMQKSLYSRLRQYHQFACKTDASLQHRNFHRSYRLQEIFKPECPYVKPPPIKDAAPLKRLKKIKVAQKSRAGECRIPEEELPCIRADDQLPVTTKKLQPFIPGTYCPPMRKDSPCDSPPLKRLRKKQICQLRKTSPSPPPCPKRADDHLKLKRKCLPLLEVTDCPCIAPEPLPECAPLKLLPKVDIPVPVKVVPAPEPCPKRADDDLEVRRKPLPVLKPGTGKPVSSPRLAEGEPLKRLDKVQVPEPERVCVGVVEPPCAPRADACLPPPCPTDLPTMLLREENNKVSLREYNSRKTKNKDSKSSTSSKRQCTTGRRNFFTYSIPHLKNITYYYPTLIDGSARIKESLSVLNMGSIERSLTNLYQTVDYFREKFVPSRISNHSLTEDFLLEERFAKLNTMKESNDSFDSCSVFPKWSAINAIVKLEVPSDDQLTIEQKTFREHPFRKRPPFRSGSATQLGRSAPVVPLQRIKSMPMYIQERFSNCPGDSGAAHDPCAPPDPCCKPPPCPPAPCTPQKGLFRRIIDYFKARPGCPTYAEIRQRELVAKAEAAAKAAGLKICYCGSRDPCKSRRVQAMEELCEQNSPKPDYTKAKPPNWDPDKCKRLKKKDEDDDDDDCDHMTTVDQMGIQQPMRFIRNPLMQDADNFLVDDPAVEVDEDVDYDKSKVPEAPYPSFSDLRQKGVPATQYIHQGKPQKCTTPPIRGKSTATKPYQIGSRSLFKRKYSTGQCARLITILHRLPDHDLIELFQRKAQLNPYSPTCVRRKADISRNNDRLRVHVMKRNHTGEVSNANERSDGRNALETLKGHCYDSFDVQQLQCTAYEKLKAKKLDKEIQRLSKKLSKIKIF